MMSVKPLGRVMVIDDEKFDQKMYRRALDRSDAADEILTFTYAEDALVYLLDPSNLPVDLILLDVKMPRMNGFEFLNALQEKTNGDVNAVILLMLTTALTQADGLRAANSPLVKECVSKPFTKFHIKLAASHVAARRRTQVYAVPRTLFPAPSFRKAASSPSA